MHYLTHFLFFWTCCVFQLFIWEFSNPIDTSTENVTLCGGFTELVELNYLNIYTLYYFPPFYDAGPMWRSRTRECGVCGANLACVHLHTPHQTSTVYYFGLIFLITFGTTYVYTVVLSILSTGASFFRGYIFLSHFTTLYLSTQILDEHAIYITCSSGRTLSTDAVIACNRIVEVFVSVLIEHYCFYFLKIYFQF